MSKKKKNNAQTALGRLFRTARVPLQRRNEKDETNLAAFGRCRGGARMRRFPGSERGARLQQLFSRHGAASRPKTRYKERQVMPGPIATPGGGTIRGAKRRGSDRLRRVSDRAPFPAASPSPPGCGVLSLPSRDGGSGSAFCKEKRKKKKNKTTNPPKKACFGLTPVCATIRRKRGVRERLLAPLLFLFF